jgi:phosphoribosylformylglycinamidine synthase subunit PurQ / glutaminase
MSRPLALVLAAPGTNRDHDVAFALEQAGSDVRLAAVAELATEPAMLDDAQLLVVAGGFSHADALGAGRVFALDLVTRLGERLTGFVERGRPVLGICNGFQTLVRAGLLPGALGHNAGGSFVCDWVALEAPDSTCVWTAGIDPFECPIAHGEGRFVHPDVDSLAAAGQIALRYTTGPLGRGNPNGSIGDIAGICDPSGLVLGLMPHPENHVVTRQHPLARRGHRGALGLQLFERGVAHARGA